MESQPPLLGQSAAAIINCNVKLKELGIESTIKLPQICVIGDQSTGKSSLIEAISTIKSPKAEGTCTACPIAINLSSGTGPDSPWTCTVSVEQRYSYNEEWAKKRLTKDHPLGPWEELLPIKITKCATTNDKEQVCNLIQRAQLANLNPGSQPMAFFDEEIPRIKAVKFSPNIVRLDVSQGSWPNLSFVDLPGVIATTGRTQDKYLVSLVDALARQYANDPNGVIMLTLPLTADAENSLAYSLIQNCNAQGRTVAVMTKPDMASVTQQSLFISKLQKPDEEFQHGFHVVMMPENTDLSTELAREMEKDFFSQGPWQNISLPIRSRLGVRDLSTYIRELLFTKTAESLPENLEAIRARLRVVEEELQALPEPPDRSQLPFQLLRDLGKFENEIKDLFLIDRVSEGRDARNKLNELSQLFRSKVAKAKPTLWIQSRQEVQELKEAEEQIERSRVQGSGTQGEPISFDSGDERAQTRGSPSKQTSQTSVFDPVHRFRLEEIRQYNGEEYQSTRPGEIEPKALEKMDRLSVQHWDRLCADYMQDVSNLICKKVFDCVDSVFGHQKHLEIYYHIRQTIQLHLDNAIACEKAAVKQACEIEKDHPLTLDAETLRHKENACFTERQQKREINRLKLYTTKLEAASGSKAKKKADVAELGPDPWETEVRMSAKTRAYYEIASTRFTDHIVLNIFGRLLPHCRTPMLKALHEYLGVGETNFHTKFLDWMTEDSDRERQRAHLQNEKRRLLAGHNYIEEALGNAQRWTPHNNSDASNEDFVMLDGDGDVSPSKRKASSSDHAEVIPETPTKRVRQMSSDTVLDEDTIEGQSMNTPTVLDTGITNRLRGVSLRRGRPKA